MPLSLLNNRISLPTFRGLINAIATQVNTNTTDIDAVEADIVTLEADVVNLNSTKQTASAVSTIRDSYDDTQTGNYTLLTTDKNKIYDITNTGSDTVFNFPATATVPGFVVGDKVIVVNNKNSTNNIVLTPTGAASFAATNLSLTLTPGDSAYVIRTGTNRYKRIF